MRENTSVSYAALRRMLKGAGVTLEWKHRGGGKRFSRRSLRSRFGELLQADAAPFDWFGNGEHLALHGFIDDAAGTITALCLCKNERLTGYPELLGQTLTTYGLPIDVYAGKAGVFFVNTKKQAAWTVEEMPAGLPPDKTRFGAVVDKPGIGPISAHTPQAKGRIERLWGTLRTGCLSGSPSTALPQW